MSPTPAPRMTRDWLRAHCRAHKLYVTPSLNDTLHLHYQGFARIEDLEEYTGLKSVFLEGNGLESLDGLQSAPGLRCIFAQQNCLTKIEHLETLVALDTLNVSRNRVDSLHGVQYLQSLTNLQAAHNQLHTVASLAALAQCPLLSSVDVTDNDLDGDPEELLDLFARMPALRALYLSSGNPIAAKLRPYRKRLIACIPGLAYLDDRPVFDAERRAAEAWARGGETEERAERDKIIEEKAAATRANFQHITQLRESAKARRVSSAAERGYMMSEDEVPEGGPYGPCATGEQPQEEEPPELVRARELLASYPPMEGCEEPIELTNTREALRKAGRLQAMPGQQQEQSDSNQAAAEMAQLEEIGRIAWARDLNVSYDDEDGDVSGHSGAEERMPPSLKQGMPLKRVLIEELQTVEGQATTMTRIPPLDLLASPRQSTAMDDID